MPAGKNLAGAFYQPALVICDTDTLDSLPRREYSSGFAEIIKYGVIAEPGLLDTISEASADNIDDIIEICVKIKRDIVEADEFEAGMRQLLNFGHTIGHAVEKASDFNLLHGEAVAVGMAMIAKAAVRAGRCVLVEIRRRDAGVSVVVRAQNWKISIAVRNANSTPSSDKMGKNSLSMPAISFRSAASSGKDV